MAAKFLVRQPVYRLTETDPDRRWQAVVNETEPNPEGGDGDRLRPAFTPPKLAGAGDIAYAWTRLPREQLLAEATAARPDWQRVAVVCGAGLGKTTNLQWLEMAVNRAAGRGGKQFAFFLELGRLPAGAEPLLEVFAARVHNQWDQPLPKVRGQLQRLRAAGRITVLLDSLDQAGPEPHGPAVHALSELLQPGNLWAGCPVWISGRPYAFDRAAELFLQAAFPAWQVLRIGQLGEAEARFLLGDVE